MSTENLDIEVLADPQIAFLAMHLQKISPSTNKSARLHQSSSPPCPLNLPLPFFSFYSLHSLPLSIVFLIRVVPSYCMSFEMILLPTAVSFHLPPLFFIHCLSRMLATLFPSLSEPLSRPALVPQLYGVLGLQSTASDDEVKVAFR
jgi:hypothetical protein